MICYSVYYQAHNEFLNELSYLKAFRNAPIGARKMRWHLSHLNARKYQTSDNACASWCFPPAIRGVTNRMSTATWGESELLTTVENYPLSLLKKLLQEMIKQFGATGGCIALYDESVGLMVIRLHMRLRSAVPTLVGNGTTDDSASFQRRVTVDLANPSSSTLGRMRHLSQPLSQPLETDPIIPVEKSAHFPVGATYSYGQD